MRALADNEPVKSMVVEGYAADWTPPGLQLQSSGTLMELQTYKGFYDNDTFGGTSGAGIFIEGTPDQLVGVPTNGVYGVRFGSALVQIQRLHSLNARAS